MYKSKKFLVDEMLKGLGRWLRAAGYDTLNLGDGEVDAVLLLHAEADGRLLLTRDRKLMAHSKARDRVVLLNCNGIDDCAAALSQQLDIDWQYHPFSRCMNCNSRLQNANAQQASMLPVGAAEDGLILYCPVCEQIYWQGSHVAAMRRRLQRWADGDFGHNLSS